MARLPETLWLKEEDADSIAEWAKKFQECFRPDGTVECERSIRLEASGIAIKVKIDILQRVGNRIAIYDLKSNKDAYEPSDTWQMPLYAWAAGEQYGVEEVDSRLWFMRYRTKPLRAAAFGRQQMEEARNWAINTARAIELAKELPGNAGFREKPGAACKLCGVSSLGCLEVFPPLGREHQLSDIGAESMAGYAFRLESALTFAKKYLQIYIAAKNASSIESNGEHWGNFPKPRYALSPEQLRDFAQMILTQEKDPSQFIEINPWVLMKRDNEDLKAWVEANALKSMDTYFGHRGKAPE